ncbi:MAG: hypothetical protein LUD72_01015 [Bacteroidales bacterium]|nr:hypothetical protein [Bacteroidales bacterium]
MVYLLTEENSELKNRSFPLTQGIRKHLEKTLEGYKGSRATDGWKRLNNLLDFGALTYQEMKRVKNFFDNFVGDKSRADYVLNGGDAMRAWVDNTLATARQTVKDFKQAKKDAGMKNAFRREHTKDRAKNVSEGRTFVVSEAQVRLLREAMDEE